MNENFRFKDLPYVRPDFAKVKTELAAITEKMNKRTCVLFIIPSKL